MRPAFGNFSAEPFWNVKENQNESKSVLAV